MDFTGWITIGLDFMKVHLFDIKQSVSAFPFSDSSYNYGHNSESPQLKVLLNWLLPVQIIGTLVQINKPEHLILCLILSPLSDDYASTSMLICCDG